MAGVLGLLAAILVGAGEFLLHFDAQGRYGSREKPHGDSGEYLELMTMIDFWLFEIER
jgi:hypothetical protein